MTSMYEHYCTVSTAAIVISSKHALQFTPLEIEDSLKGLLKQSPFDVGSIYMSLSKVLIFQTRCEVW